MNKDLDEVKTTAKKVQDRPMTTMKEVPKLNLECDDIQAITRASLLKKFRHKNRSIVSKVP